MAEGDKQVQSKTIAKNTMFLYFRMMVTMLIALYTSRVVLQILGVDDYGIYQAVGGIVGFLSFVNNALSQGSSRFITYGLGKGNIENLKKIFATTLTSHILLAVIIVVVAETVGLWFLHHKMVFPTERMDAAEWVFHFSIVTVFFTLTQVPYNACIIAHEKMTVFAYVSIVDAIFKLLIVYMLTIGQMDKLVLYSVLHFILQVSILLFYRFYCVRHFIESHFSFEIDKNVFREIIGFSGWSLFANSAIALNNQGILILLNIFFSPAVVAARSISIQVDMAAFQFVTNFQTASLPQIVKRYASEKREESKKLLLEMTKYSFYLMLLIALPIFFSADNLLTLWLGVVPSYTVIFLQLIVIQSLVQVFDTSFYKALYAKGQLRQNALLSPFCLFVNFILIYILFCNGFSPVTISWATIVCYAVMAFVLKPILIIKLVDYKWKEIINVIYSCVKVTISSIPLPIIVNYHLKDAGLSVFQEFLVCTMVCLTSTVCAIWYLGLTSDMRTKLVRIFKEKFPVQ